MKEIQGSSELKEEKRTPTTASRNWKKWKLQSCLLILKQKIPENPQAASLVVGDVFVPLSAPLPADVLSRHERVPSKGILPAICTGAAPSQNDNSSEFSLISQSIRDVFFKKSNRKNAKHFDLAWRSSQGGKKDA